MRNANNGKINGYLVFVKDEFFDLVKDPYLKINKGKNHKRPHYFAFKMRESKDMYWVAPLSSKVEKFDKIVAKKQAQGKPIDILFRTKVRDKASYVLFADMFPVNGRYLYIYNRDNRPVEIDPRDKKKALKETRKVVTLLNKGVKFMRTSPDVKRIKQVQLKQEQTEQQYNVQKDLGEFVKKYQLQENEQNQGRKL
ncbi:hypothetical protein A3O11_05515 [Ligilactobacillus aviarius]|uniref:type III toxin-antitoxin system CptIN family toxin n=1 Tax=Ligilactobacillus aviarius TaxID=1606 RepID=UPI0007DA147E|nr:hypothetical protein [Ligilactobacillus aviarius]OAQ01715.1 hypothetical protein A3O10_02570 [Ligilactobacillus aviarius]OAQ04284.1 hypothetical protein A3O11_05515 [Ligilactobacillus aviarius]OAS81114.1 hypothetical protein A3O18_00160 [Ligilactobacillus aviarius]PEG71435.1 hypothetical protein A3P04_01020 [Ligilactobacillus aviarius]PEG74345.1 hypothetical protein A3O82_01375 [Ligilactobacillus aviarius]